MSNFKPGSGSSTTKEIRCNQELVISADEMTGIQARQVIRRGNFTSTTDLIVG